MKNWDMSLLQISFLSSSIRKKTHKIKFKCSVCKTTQTLGWLSLAFRAKHLPLGSVHCSLKSDLTAKYVWNHLLSGPQCPWSGSYFHFVARCISVSYQRHNLSLHRVSFSQCSGDSSFHWPEKNLAHRKNRSIIISIPSKKWSDTLY